MTNKEALKAWKNLYSEIDKENWLFVGTINPQMVELAIKALEERPQGEWVNNECPFCGRYENYPENFCATCGADMRGDNE